MMKPILSLAALALATTAGAQETSLPADLPALTLEQQTSLRCAITFGVVAGAQERGEESALEFPPMEPRGREFFVRTAAQLMDEAGLTRDQLQEHVILQMEALDALGEDGIAQTMSPCLLLLEASGL